MCNERQYLELVQKVLDHGSPRMDRTGVGTRAMFGQRLVYDLQEGFPILTTKRVNFEAVKAELCWFLRGETNTKTLNSTIWDEWARPDGECGPIYGAQWRNWYDWRWEETVDQLAVAIDKLENDECTRRAVVSAWNVADLPYMALPPCHLLFQFYREGDSLDLQLYQRSADLALGVPFNMASYALLMHIVGNMLGVRPRRLYHVMGDAHVYNTHITNLEKQLTREPLEPPRLVVDPRATINNAVCQMFTLQDYDSHGPLKFKVAV